MIWIEAATIKKKSFYRFLKFYLRPNISVFSFLLSSFFLTGCHSDKHPQELYQQQLFTFGTLIDISLVTDNPKQARQAIDIISAEFDQLHTDWHPWKNGALGQANRNFSSLKSFSSSPSVVSLIQQSKILSAQSNGLFNPAIGQLIKLWQFDQLEDEHYQFSIPAEEKIQAVLQQKPQMQDIIVTNTGTDSTQIKSRNSAVTLDFGAFAKGVAIEQMTHILKQRNINNALINAGGDLKVIGEKKGKPWRIGIKNPAYAQKPGEPSVLAAIDLKNDESLFTSGDYERFFEFQGKHYHHIIDPRTGYPAIGTRSVTVLTKDAALADAASTALFIAGPKQWPEIARKMNIKYVMLISTDNTIYLSPAMAERIELLTDTQPIVLQ